MLKTNTLIIAKLFKTICEYIDFNGISIDSKNCKNQLFIAIKGHKLDGHNFIENAKKNGAVAIVASQKIKTNLPIIYVKNTTIALGIIAQYYKKLIHPKTIAITGSNGKTTTKNMLYNILSQVAPTLKTAGNLNNHIGVPLTLLNLEKKHKFLVVEMGANHLNEIKYLRDLVKPDIACVINTLDAHIGEFGNKKNLIKAKGEIYSKNSINIVNTNTKFNGDKSFGFGGDIDFNYLKNIKLQLLGKHNQENALAAIACCKVIDINDKIIQQGLENTKAEPGRLAIIIKNNITIIDDSYNASPTSMKFALDVLADFHGKKIVVLGNMEELGDKSAEIHAKIGKYAKSLNIDYLYSIGNLAKNYNFKHYSNANDLIKKLIQNKNTTILFKGSRSAKLEEIIKKIS